MHDQSSSSVVISELREMEGRLDSTITFTLQACPFSVQSRCIVLTNAGYYDAVSRGSPIGC